MPEESKKKQQKGRNDPKEQRRPRQRHQAGSAGQMTNNKIGELEVAKKLPNEEPGPEFYKSLKRETDEILKITEEDNSKYRKKEIQSNWSKYEMQIESYDEIQEQENMGADYEKLIQAPLSIGGHFQFKHEKSWDEDTGCSPYDKYFEINMDNLFLAISTLPFYDRNNIPKDTFTELDITVMNNRTTRFKQKYYNDITFTTSDMEGQNKILEAHKSNTSKNDKTNIKKIEENNEKLDTKKLIFNDENKEIKIDTSVKVIAAVTTDKDLINNPKTIEQSKTFNIEIDNIDDLIKDGVKSISDNTEVKEIEIQPDIDTLATEDIPIDLENIELESTDTNKNPIIESPEDLEKWLDDFLDG